MGRTVCFSLAFLLLFAPAVLSQLVEPEIESISPDVLAQGVSNVVTIHGTDFGAKPTVTVGHKECSYVKIVDDTKLECTVAGLPRSDHSTRIPIILSVDGLESQELLAQLEPSSPEITIELAQAGTPQERELKESIRAALKLESTDQVRITKVAKSDDDATKISFIVLASKMQPNAHRIEPRSVQAHLTGLSSAGTARTVRSVHVRAIEDGELSTARDALIVSIGVFALGAILTGAILAAKRANNKRKKSRSGPKKVKSQTLQETNAPEQFSPSDETVMV